MTIKKVAIPVERFVTSDGLMYSTEDEAKAHENRLKYNKRVKPEGREIILKHINSGYLYFIKDEIDLKGVTNSFYIKGYELITPIEEYPCWVFVYDNIEDGTFVCTLEYLENIVNNINDVITKAKCDSIRLANR